MMGDWAFILGFLAGGAVGSMVAGLTRSAHDGDLLTPEQVERILEDVLEQERERRKWWKHDQ